MGCGLRREIEEMLSLVPGNWRLSCLASRPGHASYGIYGGSIPYDEGVAGTGKTKEEALRNLLENWWDGKQHTPAPPATSREEFRLKLAVLGQER